MLDPLRALRERIVELVVWFGEDRRRLPEAQEVWRTDELWGRRVLDEELRWQELLDSPLPLPFASLTSSRPSRLLLELECIDHLAWLFAGNAHLAPAQLVRCSGREHHVIRLARERTPHTARQAGVIYTHLRYHALVPTRIEVDAVRSYRVRVELMRHGALRCEEAVARRAVKVATTSFGDGARFDLDELTVPTAGERAQKLGQAIAGAAARGVDILVAPELTVPPSARAAVLGELRWASGPALALLAPGSFHEREDDGGVFNRAILVDGKGNELCAHRKLTKFGQLEGWLESIALGDEITILVTPIGTVALAICKDFCDDFVGRVWDQIQPEWLLVPAYGRGARAHETAAKRIARMVGTIVVVAHEGDRELEAAPNSFVHATELWRGTSQAPDFFEYRVDLSGSLEVEAVAVSSAHPGVELVAAAGAPPAIHLNVWFPRHPGARVTLAAEAAALVLVNLTRSRDGVRAAERADVDAARPPYEVDHVDVIAVCPGADVWPLRVRLPLPPDDKELARFELTPRRAGKLELSVILLVEGESVHRSRMPLLVTSSVGEAQAPGVMEGEL